jgi:hypothetical protein
MIRWEDEAVVYRVVLQSLPMSGGFFVFLTLSIKYVAVCERRFFKWGLRKKNSARFQTNGNRGRGWETGPRR